MAGKDRIGVRRGLSFGAVLLFLGLGAACVSFYMKRPSALWERLFPIPEGEMRVVLIHPGTNARQIAQAFYDQDALTEPPARLARWMARFSLDRSFQPGSYRVMRSDAWNLARQLRAARPLLAKIALVPGTDLFSLRDLFTAERNPVFPESGDLLRHAVLDDGNYPEGMRAVLPKDEASRIAWLLPDTYFLADGSPGELVRAAAYAWWDRYGDSVRSTASQDTLAASKVASMVQREALWDAEAPSIAAVIRNRLKKGMLLQIDATVVYALKLRGRKVTRVLHRDLSVDSPYNTYRFAGLPPHPICIPGSSAWDAALGSEKNPYYYYVARKDGYHYFASSYEEHLKNIKKARSE